MLLCSLQEEVRCSLAVVGKSRTTGSLYLTSVSSTIAKSSQKLAPPTIARQESSLDKVPALHWCSERNP